MNDKCSGIRRLDAEASRWLTPFHDGTRILNGSEHFRVLGSRGGIHEPPPAAHKVIRGHGLAIRPSAVRAQCIDPSASIGADRPRLGSRGDRYGIYIEPSQSFIGIAQDGGR